MIEVAELGYAYPHTGEAVRDISFTVAPGEIFGFLGPSGAGKSTIQKVLTGLLHPFTGAVRVLGKDLRSYGPEYYENIGVGFELPNHFMKLTAVENLRFFGSFYHSPREPRELLAMVGLEKYGDHRLERFSKGMKMRLNFVRALMHDPQVLFLDEPTSGLDPGNARLLKDIILEQRALGKTVFLTTHNMHDADELCDRVAFIVDGQIKRLDTPKALRSTGAERRVTVEFHDGDGTREREFLLDGLGDQQEFLDIIANRKILSLHSTEPSLEDIFLETTGRRLL